MRLSHLSRLLAVLSLAASTHALPFLLKPRIERQLQRRTATYSVVDIDGGTTDSPIATLTVVEPATTTLPPTTQTMLSTILSTIVVTQSETPTTIVVTITVTPST